jgi:hypothetical protein
MNDNSKNAHTFSHLSYLAGVQCDTCKLLVSYAQLVGREQLGDCPGQQQVPEVTPPMAQRPTQKCCPAPMGRHYPACAFWDTPAAIRGGDVAIDYSGLTYRIEATVPGYNATVRMPSCECGAAACKSNIHSDWCPLK